MPNAELTTQVKVRQRGQPRLNIPEAAHARFMRDLYADDARYQAQSAENIRLQNIAKTAAILRGEPV